MIDKEIKKACEKSELICIMLADDPVDDFLIGFVKYCDDDGMIFRNINTRGVETEWMYIAKYMISGIVKESDYLQKMAALMEYRKQDIAETFHIADEEDIKAAFLQWIYNKKKILWFRNDDEDFYGELCSASDEYIDIAEIDYTTGKRNGHMIFRTSKLDYFGTDMAEPYIWAMA